MAENQQQHQNEDTKGPSTSTVVSVVTFLPIIGTLLLLAGFALIGSLIGLVISTPLFVIFSPVLVPAILLISGAVGGFLTSGAFGITGLSSIYYLRRMQGSSPERVQYTKRREAAMVA